MIVLHIIMNVFFFYEAKLINYWRFEKNFNDYKSNSTTLWSEQDNYNFTANFFGESNSAVRLSGKGLKAPIDVYFQGDFSISSWFRISNVTLLPTSKWQISLLEFRNGVIGRESDVVSLTIKNFKLSGRVNSTEISTHAPVIEFNSWYQAIFVVENYTGCLYLNGIQVVNGSMQMPDNIKRGLNNIGTSDPNLIITIDNIRIFRGALQPEEVELEFTKCKLIFVKVKNFFIALLHFSNKAVLINYWPMSNFSDVISQADIVNVSNNSPDLDRFSNPSAIYLKNGYLRFPPGVYFGGDFSISLWIKFKSIQPSTEIIDFGNGPGNDY